MFDIPWYVFALLSAFFVALASVIEKKVLVHDEPMHFSLSAVVILGILSLPFLFFIPWNNLTLEMLGTIYLISILAFVAFALVAYSLKRLEAGEQSLILATTPVVNAFFAYVAIAEELTRYAFLGLCLIVAGLIVLELPRLKGRTSTLKAKFAPIGLSFLAVCVYAGSAVLDRVVLKTHLVSAFDFIMLTQSFMLLNVLVIYGVQGKITKDILTSFFKKPFHLAFFSLSMLMSRLLYAQSVSMAYVALTAVLKRTGALMTIFMARSYLHEKHLGHKLLAGAIVILGVLLVIL